MKKILIMLMFAATMCTMLIGFSACNFGGNTIGPSGQETPDVGSDKEDPTPGKDDGPQDGEHVHNFTDYVYNNDATCTEDGTETGKCSCGARDTRTKKGSALEHDLEFHKGIEPTCSEDGIADYYTCSRCDYQSVEDIYLPALHVQYDYAYGSNGNEMKVVGLSDECTHGEISIPSTYCGKKVVVIDERAFAGCTSLTSIILPETVQTIWAQAFSGCASLRNVTISKTFHTFGQHAFENCNALERVTISDLSEWCKINFYEMDSNPLYYAHHLYLNDEEITELEIPQDIEHIQPYSFSRGAFTRLILPDSVGTIGIYAFADCESLANLTVGTGLREIGNLAFGDCPIDTISITDLEAWCNIQCGEEIFGGVQQEGEPVLGVLLLNGEPVTDVVIPQSVKELYIGAFGSCASLTSVSFEEGSRLTAIDYGAFFDCINLKSVAIPESVTSIGEQAFGNCDALERVTITDLAAWCNIDFGYMGNPLVNAQHLYLGDTELLELTIPNVITKIKDYAFWRAPFTSVTIHDGVTSIGQYAFSGCPLLSIEIPDGVASIGEYAFAWCDKLEGDLVIPESVKEIGAAAFQGCRSLSGVTIPEGITKIGRYTFDECNSLLSIEIPDGVTFIGEKAFEGCEALQRVDIHDISAWCSIDFEDSASNPLTCAHRLFVDGEEIRYLVIPHGTKEIKKYAFKDSTIESIIIPADVVSIGELAFEGSSIRSVSVSPDNPNYSSQDGILYNKEKTTLIFIPMTVAGAITIPDSVTSIGKGMFEGRHELTSVIIPDSVTSIGERAFYDCENLNSITIPAGVTSIGEAAFVGCFSLEHITVSDGNKVYRSEQDCLIEIETNTLVLGCKNSVIPDSVTAIGDYAFYGCALTSIAIPNKVTAIGKFAFGICGLTSITLPDGLKSIGDWAFEFCDSLKSVTIPDSVISIGDYAFQHCIGLTSITIPVGVESIGEWALIDCSSLEHITVAEGNKAYRSEQDCLIETKTNALIWGCKNSVIPNGITAIENSAFRSCGPASITIPDSVTSIGGFAFGNYNGLWDIRFDGTVEQWQAIEKEFEWDYEMDDYTITCTDGTIDKSGNVTYFAQ